MDHKNGTDMKEIEQVVSRYLKEKDTDYAIMITGEWGCGKTFYVHHELRMCIEKEKCLVDSKEECFKLLYVSLNGISDASDIYLKILENVLPVFKHKASLILRQGISALLVLKGIDKKTQKEFSNFTGVRKNNVLVFDDLERIIDEKIELKEVLGVINQFVEQDHLKVIVICNDKKVKESFSDFKEKTIRYSLQFQRPLSDSFDAIVAEKGHDDYIVYLKEQKELVLHIFQSAKCNNLRTLKFVIETFRFIFDRVKEKKYKSEILRDILISISVYAIEYKNGVKLDDLKKLSNLTSYFISHLGKEKEVDNIDYTDELWEKYGELQYEYHYYPVLNNYVTNGYLDDKLFDSFVISMNEKYKKLEDTPEGLLLKKLSDWKLIRDDEFNEVVSDAISFVENNKYNTTEIISIYSFLLAFEEYGIEGFIVSEEITQKFEKAIETAIDKEGYVNYIEERLMLNNLRSANCTVKRRKLIEHLKEENDKKKEKEEGEEINSFLNKIKNGDSEAFYQDMKRDIHHELFVKLDANKVAEILIDSPIEVFEHFRVGLYSMYPDHYSFELQEKEKDFLILLKNNINNYIDAQQHRKMSSVWYQLLVNKLNSILENNKEQ